MVLLMAQGLAQPDHVIGLRRVEALRGIRRSLDGGLEIGATVTHAEAERSPAVAAHCPALRTAFGHVATVRIRNQATVGGNLAHADPAQDPPPMLLALGAEVIAASPRGQRRIPCTSCSSASSRRRWSRTRSSPRSAYRRRIGAP